MSDWLKQTLQDGMKLAGAKADLLDGSCTIYIYGTGSMAGDVYDVLVAHGLPLGGFIDHRQPARSPREGIAVYLPEQVPGREQAAVVLGINNRETDIPAIVQRLKKIGMECVIYPVELYDQFGEQLGARYWLTRRDFYPLHEAELVETLALWDDEPSRALFRSILEFRLRGDPALLPPHDPTCQYNPPDLPSWPAPLRFVDCGAFDGDTIAEFLRSGIRVEAFAGFEPDMENFKKLTHFVASRPDELPQASLWPCGVYSNTTQLTFDTAKGSASNISAAGGTVIQCVSLDEALPGFAPNLIKMDIEGAEVDALQGARALIARHCPGLAISVYHRPEHLWQIPLWVNHAMPGAYRLSLRSHAYNDFELVLYAIPNPR